MSRAMPPAFWHMVSAGCFAGAVYTFSRFIPPRHGPFRLDVYQAEVRSETGNWVWNRRRTVDTIAVTGSACMGCGFVANARSYTVPSNDNDATAALAARRSWHTDQYKKVTGLYEKGGLLVPYVWVKAEDMDDIRSSVGGSAATGRCEVHLK